ncbi:succinylarginine dihydrolase, partial [Candidatus Marinamargulisbacteria bacterium SCGC AG-439-L15]
SLNNGGGPACLRLEFLLNQDELKHINPNFLLTQDTYPLIKEWIHTHYRESLSIKDLEDPQLIEETHTALDDLTRLLGLGKVYPFQS